MRLFNPKAHLPSDLAEVEIAGYRIKTTTVDRDFFVFIDDRFDCLLF